MAKIDIQAADLVITYNKGKSNEFNALSHINAEIYPREYIILFGPSGCGKSTLLYTILGGNTPDSGHLFVKNEDIYAYTPAEMNKYQQAVIGIVYQQFNLITSISVLDNVALPMIFLNKSVSERNTRARNLLRRFGIPERLENKTPVMMSGGQQQRVAVARSLINDPEILLADEPVGNLDSISAEHVMESFRDINEKDRKTVILVTHDAKYLPYAHRVFYMRDGLMRRIVLNPEKTQIKRTKPGETIVTEIEQLARMYPYSEPLELKVKSLVNFATQTMSFSQINQLEKAILEILKGSMDEDLFFLFLTKSVREGGVGLRPEEAAPMSRRIFGLVRHSRAVQRFREEMSGDKAFFSQQKFVDDILQYLKEEVGYQATQSQQTVLRNTVTERVSGIISADDFEQKMLLTPDMGGAMFADRDATLITRFLEKLIAQGGYVIRANELLGSHS
jgi:putative ABC transport system ATP-binding protein